MADVDDGGGAFPQIDSEVRGSGCAAYSVTYSAGGMTLRDYFAGQALAGMMANANALEAAALGASHEEFLARISGSVYRYADAMLEARK